jgi:hypothetical protein
MVSQQKIDEAKTVLDEITGMSGFRAYIDGLKTWLEFRSIESKKLHEKKPCLRACCIYREYLRSKKGKGREIDEESFFLEWLINHIIYREQGVSIYLTTAKFIKKYLERDYFYLPFSGLNDLKKLSRRIKLKVWRLKKTGILLKIRRRIKRRALIRPNSQH